MKRILVASAAVALLAASCGGSSDESADTTTASPETTEVTPATEPPADTAPTTEAPSGPSGATSLDEVRGAVVRIVGTGTFADPYSGVQANVPGSGSGFVIDPSGLAITNNHVVTGAALLEVYVNGEDKPRNARVVAVSECSDLAVIDIDGAELPYLDWYDGAVSVGTKIYAVGFPLGASEYTLLDGIVSKEDAGGETSWSSVDAVIEHSADTLPGNSGGPIVTEDGKVIAVNYAGNDLGQSFAIGIDVARPVVDQLIAGNDVNSIGINGEALSDGDVSGIWVSSLDSGSPADVAGVEAGDFLISMESVLLATDGTMSDYCDILRSHIAGDTLAIEVYRPGTDEILEGQLNGRMLEVVTSFETQFDDVVADDASTTQYSGYTTVTDDSGLISVSVPIEWSDVFGALWTSDAATGTYEEIGPAVSAAPDLDAWHDTWGTPGVFIGASAMFTTSVEATLDALYFGDSCILEGRYDYDDGVYTGLYDLYTDCGPEASLFFNVVAEPADQSWLASVQIVALTDADLVAADEIFATFVVGDLGG